MALPAHRAGPTSDTVIPSRRDILGRFNGDRLVAQITAGRLLRGRVQTLNCPFELDTDYPYDTHNPTNDSPDTQLLSGYFDRQRADSFTMTLMFQPKLLDLFSLHCRA